MKTGTIVAITAIIIIVSSALGFVIRIAFEKPVQPKTIIVFDKDLKSAHMVDSLSKIDSVKTCKIDSLTQLLTKTHAKHENSIAHVDSLPVPAVFRELSDYYK